MTLPLFEGWGHQLSAGHAKDSSKANTAKLKKRRCLLIGDFWHLVSVVVVAITEIKIKTLCVHMEDLVNRGQIVGPPVSVNIHCFFKAFV